MKKSIVLVMLCFSSLLVSGSTITWTGNAGISWSNPNNWSPTQVPVASDSVIITMDSVVIRSGTNAFAEYILITGATARLTIDPTAFLTVENAVSACIIVEMSARLYNQGNLICSQSLDKGVVVKLLGEFHNLNNLYIAQTNGDGINSLFYFKNYISGIIVIENCVQSIISSNTFINDGLITVRDGFGVGVQGGTGFVNNGNINIRRISCVNCYALSGSGNFSNGIGAIINIDDVSGNGAIFNDMSTNQGTLNIDSVAGTFGMFTLGNSSNLGTLNISNIYSDLGRGISVEETFTNAGILKIVAANRIGVEVDGNFINDAAGQVNVSAGSMCHTVNGIQNQNSLVNFGSIVIGDSTTNGIFQNKIVNDPITTNSGSISITHSANALYISDGSVNTVFNIFVSDSRNGLFVDAASVQILDQGLMDIVSSGPGINIAEPGHLSIAVGGQGKTSSHLGYPLVIQLGASLDVNGILDIY